MPSILINKLIETALARGAEGFELAAGRPPTLWVQDRKVKLDTKPLDEEDIQSFTKDLGFSLSTTDAEQTFGYRNTDVLVGKSLNRLTFRIKN